jgi:Caspase domain
LAAAQLESLRRKNIELNESIRVLQDQLKAAQTESARSSAQNALQQAQRVQVETTAAIGDLARESQLTQNAITRLQQSSPPSVSANDRPKIQLLEPASLAMRGLLAVPVDRSQQKVRVSAKIIYTHKLTLVSINGTPMSVDANGIVRADVQLKNSTTLVEIVAKDEAGLVAKLPFVLTSKDLLPPPQTFAAQGNSFGNYHALIIGNESYQYWDALQSPLDDAESIAEVLKRKYGFQVTLLKNATRNEVFRALARYRQTLKENDNLLIYYSGHGSWDSANQQGYWIPVDGAKDDISNYISASDITDQLSVIPARQVLVVADACYSGVLVKSVAEQAIEPSNRAQNLTQMAQLRSRKAMSSGNIRQVLDGGAGKHSIFAKQFLDGLERRSAAFPARELYEEIAPRVQDAAEGFGEQQEPQYGQLRLSGHVGGDFVFIPSS